MPRKDVPGFGILRMDADLRLTQFVEKPEDPAVQDTFSFPRLARQLRLPPDQDFFLASMGIYVFNRQALFDLLEEAHHDFGKDVIPPPCLPIASAPLFSTARGRTSAPFATTSIAALTSPPPCPASMSST